MINDPTLVHAPFCFAPIPRWVHFPKWGPLVSHDVPFQDGLCGEIDLALQATTPLLAGGARRKAIAEKEGEVWPFQLPGGRWAIPPSSLQGMTRAILEIATFARLGPWVEKRGFTKRDTNDSNSESSDARTTHDLLRNSTSEHVGEGRFDLPSLIFGIKPREKAESGLKRRASFDLAVCEKGNHPLVTLERAVLLSPKPSYFPIYVRQPGAEKGKDQLPIYQFRKDDGWVADAPVPYATYTPLDDQNCDTKDIDGDGIRRDEHEKPELAGVKLWPARGAPAQRWRPDYLPADKHSVETTLHARQAGTSFHCKLRFHNLRRIELGALLWAFSFGEDAAWKAGEDIAKDIRLRHRLGMGKPYGLGEIAIAIRGVHARDIQDQPVNDPKPIIKAFTGHMVHAYQAAANREVSWENSVQIQTLLKAANPTEGANYNQRVRSRPGNRGSRDVCKLDYMELNPKVRDWNDFANAKKAAHFLPRYAEGHELDRPARLASPQTDPTDPAGTPGEQNVPVAGTANRAFKVGDRVQSSKAGPGTIVSVPEHFDPHLWLVKWDKQGGAPQWIGEKKLTKITDASDPAV